MFPLFGHTETVSAKGIQSAEELFIWFEREPTNEEKQSITASAPAPLRARFDWGQGFAYFGSAGDTYKYAVKDAYGKDLKQYASDYFDWLNKTHAVVPIAFTIAPPFLRFGELSDWGTQSDKKLAAALTTAMQQPKGLLVGFIVKMLEREADDSKSVDKNTRKALREYNKPPSTDALVQKTFNLIRENKVDVARMLLRKHLAQDPTPPPGVWNNLLLCQLVAPADLSDVDQLETLFAKTDLSQPSWGAVLKHYCIVAGNNARYANAVRVVDEHWAVVQISATDLGELQQAYGFAAYKSPDPALTRAAVERLEAWNNVPPPALHNLAALYFKLGNKTQLMATLAKLRSLRYAALDSIWSDPDFAPMQKDADFAAFFGKA